MKRFVNYKREDGEMYEICAEVIKNESNDICLTIGFREIPMGDVMKFAVGNDSVSVTKMEGVTKVVIPIGMVRYIGGAAGDMATESIRCCNLITKE